MAGWTVLATLTMATVIVSTTTLAQPPVGTKGKAKAADGSQGKEFVKEVLATHNRERAKAKLSPLSLDPKLTAAAEAHAKDMARQSKMTHEGSDGSSPADRVKRQGYHYISVGENVAEGYQDVDELMRGWMESPHHRENILGNFSQAGIARTSDSEEKPYWCVVFGNPYPKLDPATAAADLVRAINDERSTAGLPPLKPHPALNKAAAQVAQGFARADSLDRKKHEDDVNQVVNHLGYRYRKLAESAGSGQPDASEVLKSWMASPAHKDHLLGDFTEIGVGYAASRSDTPFWTLILARPLGK